MNATTPPIQVDVPTEVRNDRDTQNVAIRWASGADSLLPYQTLRGYCPCAVCQGHGAGPRKFVTPPAALALAGIRAVGNYALQLQWSDGHSTGLYTYEYLRELAGRA